MTIQLKRNTAAGAAANNEILAAGQPGWDSTNRILKIGDGTTHWNDLPAILDSVYEPINLVVVPTSLAGITDATSAVQALITAALAGGATRLHVRFPAPASGATYNFAGTLTTPPGVLVVLSGEAELVSTAGLAIFNICAGATANTDGFSVHRGLKLTCLVDADYGSGLLVLSWIRNFRVDIDIKMSGTGVGVLLDTSYDGTLDGQWRMNRYAVGYEMDARLNPTAQTDRVEVKATIQAVHGGIVRTATGNIHGLTFPGRFVSLAPEKWVHAETTLSASSSIGDTTVSVAAGTVTVTRPLRFAHASGQPVVYGGFCASLSSYVRGATFKTTHIESTHIGVLADTPTNLIIGDAVYSSVAETLRVYGVCVGVHVGQVRQGSSTAVANVIVNDTGATSLTDCWIDGPCVQTNGSSIGVHLTTAAKFGVSARLGPSGNTPTVVAAAGLGTSPPAPTVTGGDHAFTISFGSGASTTAAAILTVTFSTPFAAVPQVMIGKGGNYGGTFYKTSAGVSGFSIAVTSAVAASQAAGTFSVDCIVVGSKVAIT